MCGICGMVGLAEQALLERMTRSLRHRGPDDEGYYTDGAAGLGMARLSIIDVAGGRQPMTDERKRYWLVFNGEIYNHAALRKALEAAGHRFATRSDTEVIVHLYEDLQERCVERLDGDFAFAIWDTAEQRLFLARDRLGVKPLYYWHQGSRFAFASELKALLGLPGVSKDLDEAALDAYLAFLYVPSPQSIFRDIRKLPPACWLTFQKGEVRIQRYWQVPAAEPRTGSMEELSQRILDRLREAVRERLMSEVPLGAFLSGGIDSSAVVALMSQASAQPVRTFSIGFESPYESYNELPFARLAAQTFRTEHHEFIVRADLASILPQVVWHLDEPFADSSALVTFLIAREARRHVTVALTGIGGDEAFGGYPRYLGAWLSRSYARLPRVARVGLDRVMRLMPESTTSDNAVGRLKRFVEGGAQPPLRRYLHWISYRYGASFRASPGCADPLSGYEARLAESSGDYLDRINRLDLTTYLPDDLLMLGDKMSMAHGLEVRVPFCDHRLVELAAAIPLRRRMEGWRLKGLLKQALRGVLPEALLHKPKRGFMVPLGAWLKGELQPLCRDLLSPRRVSRRGFFRPEAVQHLLARHASAGGNVAHQLYALMVLELWCQRYLD